MNGKTLKEIYEYDFVSEDGESNIEPWFNSVMLKTPEQLTVADLCRMLRQRIFSVVAIEQAIGVIKNDPFAGDIYEGQLMVSLCKGKEKYLAPRYKDIAPLLDMAALQAKSHKWESENEKEIFLLVIQEFAKKIRESEEIVL